MAENRRMNMEVGEVDLAQFDEDFESFEEEEPGYEAIPDGRYQVVVESVELTRTRNRGVPMLKWALRITGGPFEGRMLFKNNVMATRENIRWLKRDLVTAGLRLRKLSELPAHLERLLDVRLEVSKRTRDENENVYFNKRLQSVVPGPSQLHSQPDDEDDLPF